MMLIENKYRIGQSVYLITDTEQKCRMVTGIFIKPEGLIYFLSCGSDESEHYDFEISLEKDLILSTSN